MAKESSAEHKQDQEWILSSETLFNNQNDEKCDFWGTPGGTHVVSGNRLQTTQAKYGEHTTYSNSSIKSTEQLKIRWELKIIERGASGYDFAIGIVSEPNDKNSHYWKNCSSKQSYMYLEYKDQNYKKRNDSKKKNSKSNFGLTKKFAKNDIFVCELDLVNRDVTFYHNGTNLGGSGSAFDDIDVGGNISYYLAVSIYGCPLSISSIEIKRYAVYLAAPSIAAYNQDLVKFSSLLDDSIKEMTKLKLNIKNGTLSKQSSLPNLVKISKDFEKLQEISDEIQTKTKQLGTLIDEAKQELKSILTPNCNNYKSWKLDDIIIWINSLEEGKYSKYCGVLEKSFGDDDVQGGDLPEITREDLKGFGINVFRDRVALVKHFQSLSDVEGNVQSGNTNNAHDTVDVD